MTVYDLVAHFELQFPILVDNLYLVPGFPPLVYFFRLRKLDCTQHLEKGVCLTYVQTLMLLAVTAVVLFLWIYIVHLIRVLTL